VCNLVSHVKGSTQAEGVSDKGDKEDIWAYNGRYDDVRNCTSSFTICTAHQIQVNPVITTSVYATPRLYRQIFCGTNKFRTVNHNITQLSFITTQNTQPVS
jgi:hypothetical protein